MTTKRLRKKVLSIVNENITHFLKDDQIINVLDYSYKLLYDGNNLEDIEGKFADCLLRSFDEDQQDAIMIFGIKIMSNLGLDGMDILINKTVGALRPIMFPYMYQIQNRMFEMKKFNKNVNDGIDEGYSMTITFATPKIIKYAFCKFIEAFTEDEWNVIYPDYDQFFMVKRYINSCF